MTLEKSFIGEILSLPLEEALPEAQRLKQEFHGNIIRRIQPVNGYLLGPRCNGDCDYCGWNCHIDPANDTSHREKLTPEKLASEADHAISHDTDNIEIINNTIGITPRLLEELRALSWVCDRIPTGLNIGLVKDVSQIQALTEMGYVYYVNDLETAPRIYQGLVGTHRWEEKLLSIKRCNDARMELHSGLILGLGENNEDLAGLVRKFDEFGVRAVVVNFFSPVNGVSLPANKHLLTPKDCLKRLSQVRIMFPEAQLVLGGGRRAWIGENLIRESFMVVDSLYVRNFLNHGSSSYWLKESQVIAEMGLD